MPPSPAPDTCLLFLLRHGATENNVARPALLQGRRTNQPLSPAGRLQAEQTALALREFVISAVYSSPLVRARETAALVAAPHALPVQVLDELTECDVGRWEGLSWRQIEERDPEAHRLFLADPATHPYLGGENLEQVRARITPVVNRLLAAHAGQIVVVVGHNIVNRVYLAPLLGVPMTLARGIYQENCGLNILRHRQGETRVITVNSVLHLSQW